MKRHPLHDYAHPSGYFITFITAGRAPILGRVSGTEIAPSAAGKIVQAKWKQLPGMYPHVVLDAFQIMPDHVHCILILIAIEKDGKLVNLPIGIPKLMNAFKSICTREIRQLPGMAGRQVWQRGPGNKKRQGT